MAKALVSWTTIPTEVPNLEHFQLDLQVSPERLYGNLVGLSGAIAGESNFDVAPGSSNDKRKISLRNGSKTN